MLFKKIAKNTLVLIFADLVGKLFLLLYNFYVANSLGSVKFGIISNALAFMAIYENFNDLGLNQLTVREIAKNKALTKKYIENIISIKLILSILTFFLILLSVKLLGYTEINISVTLIVGIGYIILILSNIFNNLYQSHERMEFQSMCTIIYHVLLFLLTYFVIILGLNLLWFAGVYVIISTCVLILNVMISRLKFFKPKPAVDLYFWKSLIWRAGPFFIGRLSISLYTYVSFLILAQLQGDAQVGVYNATFKIVFILLTLMTFFYIAIYPTLSRLYKEGNFKSINNIIEFSIKFLTIISVMVGIFMNTFAGTIINLIYTNKDYTGSIPLLKILIWRLVFFNISSMFSYLLLTADQQKKWMFSMALNAFITTILNLIFIYYFGLYGAAYVSIISEAFVAILLIFMARPIFNLKVKNSLIKLLICNVIAIIILYAPVHVDNLIKTAISFITFVILIFSLKIITIHEIKDYITKGFNIIKEHILDLKQQEEKEEQIPATPRE
ncbi:MAG: flippase [Promethearchaeota archaeon]